MSMQTEAVATLPPPPSQSSASSKRKKKRKKSVSALSNYSSDEGDGGTILQSKLSLKKQLSLKKSCKQTPWYDTNELIQTGSALLLSLKLFPTNHIQQHHQSTTSTPEGLTPDEHTQLQLAFQRVAVWRGHSARGRLSHAVDVTAGLAGLLLSDAERTCRSNATDGNNPYQLRNSYSTLLLRSVNGLADTYRHQRKSSLLSVSHCCALAGLPLWIVDIRHDASHNDLPSLGLCRIGAIESLRFWKTRYWDTLENKVWGKKSEIGALPNNDGNTAAVENDDVGICTHALDCLVRYQQAALSEAKERRSLERNKTKRGVKRQLKQEDASDKADYGTEDLLLLPDEPKRVEAKPKRDAQKADSSNPFAILHSDKSKKKKQKNHPRKDGVATNGSGLASGDNEDTAIVATNESQASSRDCAAEFVREIPMDIAITLALKFLVWGIGDDDLKIRQGPAILLGHAELLMTQDADDTFDNLRAIYDPLMIAITNAYPGFIAALFVNLIDSILCLDSEKESQDERSGQDVNLVTNDSELYLRHISCNIQYLSMWVHYIFSREFHMHFNRSAAIYVEEAKSVLVTSQTGEKREFQSQPIDLKKKGKKNWTQQQLKFMQSHLQCATFQSFGIPMNSVCDRLLSHRDKYFCNSDSIVGKLSHSLESILGENRVVCMGLVEQTKTKDTNDGACVATAADEVERGTALPDADKSAVAAAFTDATLTAKGMSLEDVEAFISSATTPEDKSPETGTKDALDNVHDGLAKRPTIEALNAPDIKPWTLCTSWDSCAIGSMPGFPA